MSLLDLFGGVKAKAKKHARALIHLGLQPLDEVAREVSSAAEKLSAAECRALVAEEWEAAKSKPPPAPTAFERLEAAFASLESAGILARHYPDAGRSEAHGLIREELAEARHQGKSYVGFCFWDEHVKPMLAEGALAFQFGVDPSPPTYRALWAGQRELGLGITAALSDQGFHVSWDGSAGSSIVVGEVDWSGPRDEDGAPKVATGPRLKLGRKPKPVEGPKVTSVFVGGPAPGTAVHAFLTGAAKAKGTTLFGSADGTDGMAVDFAGPDGLLDLVAGPNNAPRPPAFYLLQSRDLARECRLMVDVAETDQARPSTFWADFRPEHRLRVVRQRLTSAQHDGSACVAIGAEGEDVAKALTALEELARALETKR